MMTSGNILLAAALSRILVAISVCICAAEYIGIEADCSDTGIFSNDIHRGPSDGQRSAFAAITRVIYSRKIARVSHFLQLGLGLILFLPLGMSAYSFVLFTLFALVFRTFSHTGIGNDGSDQMLMVVLPSLGVAYGFHLIGPAAWLAIWFIVAQSVLAYGTSGISKLMSPTWRSGRALGLIVNTAGYGSSYLSKHLLQTPKLGRIGSWGVIAFECVLLFVLVLPAKVAIALLGIAFIFHCGCALAMGLNCFIWAFASTYPLVLLCNVDRTTAIKEFIGDRQSSTELLAGGVIALIVVATVVFRYYELADRISMLMRTRYN